MNINKILKADGYRKSRFHDLDGFLIPWTDFFSIPKELMLRFIGVKRKGPWLGKPAVNFLIELLETKLNGNARILEIGGGASTNWFAERCSYLVTVEESEEWAKAIRSNISQFEHKHALFVGKFLEVESLFHPDIQSFDLILIDGETDSNRLEICKYLISFNKRAIYVLDNSDRSIFQEINTLFPGKQVRKFTGLIRHPFQATQTSFYL